MSSLLVHDPPVAQLPPVETAVVHLLNRRCVVVSGPAGVGKTRTLRESAERLRAAGHAVIGVRATASLATVPFGALLPLLAAADLPGPRSRTDTALALLALLRGRGDAVVIVDDAHLLDAASAGLLHQVALAGAPLAVSIRDGERAPDAIRRLQPDLAAESVVVPRLTEGETRGLLVEVLGAEVDDVLARTVHHRSGGLPLAVETLARVGRASGTLTLVRGEWVLRGPIPASGELADLLRDAVDALDDDARRAAELVALAEGLSEPQLGALAAAAGAEGAEAQGVLAVDRSGTVLLAHPLHLDALLARMPALRRRRRLTELVDRLEPVDSVVARLRHVEWRLELGRDVAAEELLGLVEVTAADAPERAERYARAAAESGGGVAARLRLAELLAHLHRADEAEQVLTEIDGFSLDDGTRVLADITRAFLLVFALARPDEGLSVLAPLGDHPMVAALRSTAHYNAGRLERAFMEASAVVERIDAPADARAHAALTRASVLVLLLDHAGFQASLPDLRARLADAEAAIPEGKESVRLLEGMDALRVRLDPLAAERIATAGYRAAMARGDDGERSQWSHQLGEAALLRGDARAAADHLRRAARGRGRWATSTVGWVRGTLVRALALAGEHEEAFRELADLRAVRVMPCLLTDVALAEAETAAAEGDLRRAGRLAEEAARARRSGAVDAWYAAMRFGRPGAATAFLKASAGCSGAGRLAQRDHARSVIARDPHALEAASARLDAAGLGWFAVEAMAHAVQAHAATDLERASLQERLRDLVAAHPSLRSPIVAAVDGPALTERESQIARLVAGGLTARAVAEALGVGVRTVETHVGHVYRKLGVRTRDELRRALHIA